LSASPPPLPVTAAPEDFLIFQFTCLDSLSSFATSAEHLSSMRNAVTDSESCSLFEPLGLVPSPRPCPFVASVHPFFSLSILSETQDTSPMSVPEAVET